MGGETEQSGAVQEAVLCRCHEKVTFFVHNASREIFWHLDSIFFFVRQAE